MLFASVAVILALVASPFSIAAPVPVGSGGKGVTSPSNFNPGGPLINVSNPAKGGPGGAIPLNPPKVPNPGGPIVNSTSTGTTNPGGLISLPTSLGTKCSLAGAKIDFPAGQTALAVPSADPKIVALGVGVQNYTCVAGTWTSIGAVAKLYDISCAVSNTALMNSSNFEAVSALEALATKEPVLLSHFFVNSTAGLEPRFNEEPFQTTNVGTTFSKTASLASPNGATNVAWLQLTSVAGSLASSGYRTDTVLGAPPTSCNVATDTSTLSVNYQAHYYFYA